MNLSYEEKVKRLGFEEQRIAHELVDMLYMRHIEQNKPFIVLQLVNNMLTEIDYDPITQLDDFKVVIADMKKLDGTKFINNNLEKLQLAKISPVKDLKYEQRNKLKDYGLRVLKELVKLVDYKVQTFCSRVQIDDVSKSVQKYRLIKT